MGELTFATALMAILALIIYFLMYHFRRTRDYWKNLNVRYIDPLPLFGNIRKMILMQQSPSQCLGELYNSPESKDQRLLGIYLFNNEPAVLLKDPELIKNVFVKDFAYFSNRNVYCNKDKDPIGYNNLFVIRGKKWKYLRAKLTPFFTSGKMKQMFHLIREVGEEFKKHIDQRLENGEQEIETKELTARYTTDVISTCAFGIASNSLNDPNALFRMFGKKIFETDVARTLAMRAFFFIHWWVRLTGTVFMQKESNEFFRNVFWNVVSTREKEETPRNDFIDTLLTLKKEAQVKSLTEEDGDLFDFSGDRLVAQPVIFFSAGFETTSSTITYALVELACAPDIQEKLRLEILESIAENGGDLTYDGVHKMTYLDMVVSETLRKYPPMPFIDRVCTKDYKVPDSDLLIKKGTPVFVNLYHGIHYDAKHFPDPEKFDPSRFSVENKSTRHPFAYLPFGDGPHICIGMRFGLMNVKLSLSLILRRYKVEPTDGIALPIKMDPRNNMTSSLSDMTLRFIHL